MKRWDAVIIGSGISSLTCAALLARQGRSVCVLEKHTKPGGYLHCFKRFGKSFDTGAHYVGSMAPGEAFHALLNYLGVFNPDHFIPLSEEGFDEFHFPSFQSRFSFGYERTISDLCDQFPKETSGIRNYFERMRETVRHFPTYHYSDHYDEKALAHALETPLLSVLSQEIKDPKLHCVLLSYCALHGVQGADVAFGLHAVLTDSLLRGAYGFRQGGDALAQSFVKVIEASGGKVVTKSPVTKIKVKSGTVTEVISENETYQAEWVISGIHPKTTMSLISEAETHFRPAYLKRVQSLKESPGVMGIYAVCRKAPSIKADRNYYFFDEEDPETFLSPRSSDSKPAMAFVARPERTDSELYPALLFHGMGSIDWYARWKDSKYGQRSPDYEQFKDSQARAMIEWVDERRPGLKDDIEKYAVSSPLSNLHFNGSMEGSAYGIYHSITQTGARALGPRTHLDNLLLTGQNCLFPGLLGAATSGLRTAGSLLGIKEILRELKDRQVGT